MIDQVSTTPEQAINKQWPVRPPPTTPPRPRRLYHAEVNVHSLRRSPFKQTSSHPPVEYAPPHNEDFNNTTANLTFRTPRCRLHHTTTPLHTPNMHHSAASPSLFQPPTSPASPIATPSNDYFSRHSRKRQRPTSSYSQHDLRLQTPGAWREEQNQHQRPRETLAPSWVQCPTPTDNMYDSACAHNSALVNERYTLQGGFDTPGLMASGAEDRFSKDGDMEFRRRVRDPDYIDRGSAGHAMISGPLARERNGVARMPSSSNGGQGQNQPGWASFAFNLVGKVFNFGSSVIQGFYAGGGKGYDLQQQSLADSWTQPQQRGSRTPVPGSWQDDDDASSPTTQPARPPNKRRHIDKDAWVLVGTSDHTDLSPKRKASSTSIPRTNPAMMRPRPSSRRSLAPVSRRTSSYNGSPAQHPSDRRASVAPTRSPNHPSPHARPSSSHRPRPSLTHSPRQSFDAHPNGRPSSAGAGLSPEADRYIKRQARQDKAADKAIGSMNRQLKDLITQAREALGTRVDVDVDVDMDMEMEGGFVDE